MKDVDELRRVLDRLRSNTTPAAASAQTALGEALNALSRAIEIIDSACDETSQPVGVAVTPRKLIENTVARKTTALELTEHLAKSGYFEHDWDTGSGYHSSGFNRLLGRDGEGPVANHRILHHVHPDDRARVLEHVRHAVERHEPLNIEFRLIAEDGTVREVAGVATTSYADDGRPARTKGTLQDTSERRAAELALLNSQQRFRLLFENAPIGVLTTDTRGNIVDVNHALTQILDSGDVEATRSLNVLEFKPFVESGVSSAIERCLETGKRATIDRPYPIEGRDPVHLRCHIAPIFGAEEEVSGAQLMVEDFSDIKSAEEQRKAMEERLHQSLKMESIGRLAGGVAHDFNNLLMVINSYAALAIEELGEDAPISADLREILDAGEAAAVLTKQLLAFGGKQMLRPALLDVNDLVSGLQRMLGRLIGEDIDLVVALSSDVGLVYADRSRIEQVLVNLVVNARDAMQGGGRVTIETDLVNVGPHGITLDESTTGPYVAISVRDTGPGLAPDVMARVFEPFFTTKEQGRGTGLGLATAYGTVSQSGGHLVVESEPGHGAVFTVYLAQAKPRTEQRNTVAPTADAGSQTILVVEDDPMVRNVVRRVLGTGGYRVQAVGEASEAIALFEESPDRFSLLITDIVMPHMNGRQLAERLLDLRPTLPVLYMSGYTDDEILRHGVERQGVQFLPKPFRSNVLLEKVKILLKLASRGSNAGVA